MDLDAGSFDHNPSFMKSRIVVGVDGSPLSMRALAWAAEEARLRGAGLEVVHVDFCRQEALEALAPGLIEAEQLVLKRAVARVKALVPGILVVGRLCDPPPGKALIAASEGAEMLVVGCRGLSGLRELAMGSVSKECAHGAFCPVVIIRPEVSAPIGGTAPSDCRRFRRRGQRHLTARRAGSLCVCSSNP
jgi:nucleotide-binding universal stress UspA family protein